MRGAVVRGVGGQREKYRPIVTQLSKSPEPVAVAKAIVENFGLSTFYVADLDAITEGAPATQIYTELLRSGVELLVDAGVAEARRATALSAFRAGGKRLAGIIAGLESLSPAPDSNTAPAQATAALRNALAELVDAAGAERLIFSIDLRGGQPVSRVPAWQTLAPRAIAAAAVEAGVERLIVLDLADVGSAEGTGTLDLCSMLRADYPQCELTAGGGVRGVEDLDALAAVGCDNALVASALHDGQLTEKDCQRYGGKRRPQPASS